MEFNINFVLVCAIVLIGALCIWLSWDLKKPTEKIVAKETFDKQTNLIKPKQMNQETWETQLFRLQTHGLAYPPTIKSRFFYETSVCKLDLRSSIYQARWIESPELDLIETQDYTSFLEQIQDGADINQTARSFYNKSGDTLLIIPYPHPTIQYPTIKEFIDNAPQEDKMEFWKFAVDQIKQFVSTHGQAWISTHGLGVSYFHLRVCTYPKYYQSKDLI
jgi:hypothetical protein